MVGPVVAGDLLNYSESDCDYTGRWEVGGGRWDTDRGREEDQEEERRMQQLTLRHFRLHLSIRTVKLAVERYLVECFFPP